MTDNLTPAPITATTIRAGRVLTDAFTPVSGPCEVAIGADGLIAAVTPITPDRLTEAEAGALLIPALADAHDHGRGLRPLAFGAPDQSLESWLPDLTRHPPVDPWLNAAVALGRLARNGVASVSHCHNTQDGRALLAEAEAVSRAARDVGISVAFAWPFFDRNPMVYGPLADLAPLMPADMRARTLTAADGMRDCATNMALFEQAKAFEHAGFTLHYHPVAPQWARPETLAAIARASAADGRRVHMHLLETELQRQWADAHHPQGLLVWLDELGLLNDRLTLAHAVWLNAADMALLADRGVTVSVNFSSNLRLRSGFPKVAEMLAAGVRVAFGLDGMALDDDEDMLRELRLAWHASARPAAPGEGLDPRTVLHGALENGCRSIMGRTGGGRIAVGAPADLAVLDFARMAADCIMPEPDPVRLLLGRAQARHVRQVIARGRIVAQHGHCTGIDLAALETRLTQEARAARMAHPCDEQAIVDTRTAVCAFYEAGHHAKPA